MRGGRALILGSLVLSFALPAIAGRPFTTEDAGVLEARDCELEAFISRATARGAANETGGSAQAGCGVGWQTQLAIGVSRAKSGPDRTTTWQLVGKTFIVESRDDRAGLTLAYRLATSKPPGARHYAHDSSDLVAVTSVPWRGAVLHANLGWTHSHADRQDSTVWALAYERPWGGGVDVGAEVFGDDREPAWLGLALRWALIENVFVDASLAFQASSQRARGATLGMKIAF